MMGHSGSFVTGAWEILRRIVLSASAAAVQFEGLPTCRAFRLSINGLRRSTGQGPNLHAHRRSGFLTFNGDFGAGNGHYRYTIRHVYGSSDGISETTTDGVSTTQDYVLALYYPDLAGNEARTCSAEIVICDSPNRYKTVHGEYVVVDSDQIYAGHVAAVWGITDRIHTIRLEAGSPLFAAGAEFVLEGLL